MPERASEWFKKRIELGGWVEEVTVSYQQLGECYKLMGKRDEAWRLGWQATITTRTVPSVSILRKPCCVRRENTAFPMQSA